MTVKQKIEDIFYPMCRDGGLLFILLATLLVTVSMYSTYAFRMLLWPMHKTLLLAVPYAFAWVVFAWIITDKSIIRKATPYIVIFFALFFEKIYWALFYYFYPITYTNLQEQIQDAMAIGSTNLPMPSADWFKAVENAENLFIILEFIVAFVLFLTIWHLTRPRDFMKTSSKFGFIKTKRSVLLMISAILMTVPLWIWRAIGEIGGPELIRELFSYTDLIDWYSLLFYGIPIGVALVIFAYVITNIHSRAKGVLYLIIFLSVLVPYIPMYDYMFWVRSSSATTVFTYFFIFAAMYFVLFLSLLLLSKTKYIEQ